MSCAAETRSFARRSSASWRPTSGPSGSIPALPGVPDANADVGARLSPFWLRGFDVQIRCPHCRNPIELAGLTASGNREANAPDVRLIVRTRAGLDGPLEGGAGRVRSTAST